VRKRDAVALGKKPLCSCPDHALELPPVGIFLPQRCSAAVDHLPLFLNSQGNWK
jgi:hypothetical protein